MSAEDNGAREGYRAQVSWGLPRGGGGEKEAQGRPYFSLQPPEGRLQWAGGQSLLPCNKWQDEKKQTQVVPGGEISSQKNFFPFLEGIVKYL